MHHKKYSRDVLLRLFAEECINTDYVIACCLYSRNKMRFDNNVSVMYKGDYFITLQLSDSKSQAN